tara:strand:+ start:47 stop:205 length:159 start_codon:yes stop_codon:yes gene_type:complete
VKPKGKKKYKEYDLFYMQFGFKQEKRIKNRNNFSESEFWEKLIKDEKKKIKF